MATAIVMTIPLCAWAIYDHPGDYPESFVARRYDMIDGEAVPTTAVMVANNIDALRQVFRERGLERFTRDRDDPTTIVETWL